MKILTRKAIAVATLALCALTGSQLAAQQPPPPQGRQGTPPVGRPNGRVNAPGMNPSIIEELIDTRVLKLSQKELQLTDAQFPEFFRSMELLQQTRRNHTRDHNALMNQLRRLTNQQVDPPPDNAALEARVKEIGDLETQMFQEEQRLIGVIDRILTPFQRARFRIFEERMENQKLELIAQAKAAGGPPKNPEEF